MLTQDFRHVLGHPKPILAKLIPAGLTPTEPAADDARLNTFVNVTGDEPYLVGHFPGFPIVPGVLIVEAMAQTAVLLVAGRFGPGLDARLVGVEKARFFKPVLPPARLRFLAWELPEPGASGQFVRCACTAFVGEVRVARAELLLSMNPGPASSQPEKRGEIQ